MSALVLALALTTASAEEVVVQNDTATDGTFGTSDRVAWLAYPECAISVLTADPGQLPLTIDTIRFYFGSNTGNQDGTETLVERQQLSRGGADGSRRLGLGRRGLL